MRSWTLLLLLMGPTVWATNYYVKTDGNDSNNGLSPATAFRTLQQAANQTAAGDTVLVADGIYTAGFDHRNKSGTAAQPIVYQALGLGATITGSGPIRDDGINVENANYVVVDGFRVVGMTGNGNGVRLVNADFCTVRNTVCDQNAERGIFTGFTDDLLLEHNICTNSVDEHGIYVSNSSDRAVIRYNVCYGNNNIGIHLNGDASAGGDGIMSDFEVYGNVIYDNNRAAGINLDGCENPVIYNNLIFNNHNAQGIALFRGDGAIPTRGALIYNNTILVPDDGRWGILVNTGSNVGTRIFNNIVLNDHPWRGSITIEDGTDFQSDYNLVNDKLSNMGDGTRISFAQWQAAGYGTNSQIADPPTSLFEDPTQRNYRLLANSQALNAGTNVVNTVVNVDYLGTPRPRALTTDIGAFERIRCPDVWGIQRNFSTETYIFSAETQLLSSHKIVGTADVIVQAGSLIRLQPGFQVSAGAEFTARINNCQTSRLAPVSAVPFPIESQLNNQQNPVRVFPNPTTDNIFVEWSENFGTVQQVQLTDAAGRLYAIPHSPLDEMSSYLRLSIGHLPKGLYYVLLTNERGTVVTKVIRR